MYNEIAVERESKTNNVDLLSKIKSIANDSLFYFGIFLSLLFLLQKLPVWTSTSSGLELGINEVVVAFIGYINIFFFQAFRKILCKSH